ncbi:MAG: ACT domain-containing protein [Gammaproteobacteria bacterium]|nr:ACT domain-containing protein [Gammaproteobacteria bacterium]
MSGIVELERLLAGLEPELAAPEYLFCALASPPADLSRVFALVREEEAWTVVAERERAEAEGWVHSGRFRRIVLRVHSSLEAVGLTAAVAGALARLGISANVVAAYYHDHVFVPAERAEEALAALRELSHGSR